MERLTTHDPDRQLLVCSANYKSWNEIYDRLAAYEDTGLEPEEIGKWKEALRKLLSNISVTGNRMIEIANAESEGRLLVPPCKVGDTVYANTRSKVSSFEVKGFFIGRDGDIFVRWNLLDGIYGPHRMDGFTPDKIGKTVFHTREEAEKAMEGDGKDE